VALLILAKSAPTYLTNYNAEVLEQYDRIVGLKPKISGHSRAKRVIQELFIF
jgi:hypothetical protein